MNEKMFEPVDEDRTDQLRLTKRDLVGIKAAAKEEDIPYQTLIGHLVRKYLEERVRERMEITQP